MVGNNEMNLNEATMKRILQYYFDNALFRDEAKATVASVKSSSSNYNTFTVIFSDEGGSVDEG